MTDRYAGCTYTGIFLWGGSVLLKQFSPSSPHARTSQRCIRGYERNFFQLRLHQHDWALLFPDIATAFTHHSCRGLFSQQGEPNAFPSSLALPKAASTGSRKQSPTYSELVCAEGCFFMGSREWSSCHDLYSLYMYIDWRMYLHHQRWMLYLPMGGQSTE